MLTSVRWKTQIIIINIDLQVPASIATLHADEVLPTTLDNNVYEEYNISTSTIIPEMIIR